MKQINNKEKKKWSDYFIIVIISPLLLNKIEGF